jgi:FMN-dependent oxidoreductase (nitrilotriacetate monooxygenase family)
MKQQVHPQPRPPRASWRHPASSPLPLTDIRYYQDLAQRAEAALFDSIFLADQLALGGDVAQAPRTWLEPITVLAAVAVATSRVGLIATASTTYTESFNLARQKFASIDHISRGRAARNIVTSWLATAAENFGGAGQVSHADRYARGEEFMEILKALWDSWAADAVIDDRAAGIYVRRDRIRSINHRGDFYQVAGPLNMPRAPQGRPVLVQAGSSDTGRRFARGMPMEPTIGGWRLPSTNRSISWRLDQPGPREAVIASTLERIA